MNYFWAPKEVEIAALEHTPALVELSRQRSRLPYPHPAFTIDRGKVLTQHTSI